MRRTEQPSKEKGGAPQSEIHKELAEEIMSLTEEEVVLIIRLVASSPI